MGRVVHYLWIKWQVVFIQQHLPHLHRPIYRRIPQSLQQSVMIPRSMVLRVPARQRPARVRLAQYQSKVTSIYFQTTELLR